jgi:hypothetical protein
VVLCVDGHAIKGVCELIVRTRCAAGETSHTCCEFHSYTSKTDVALSQGFVNRPQIQVDLDSAEQRRSSWIQG